MTTIHELSDMLEKANKALLSAAQTIEVLGMENQKMREASAKFYANQSPQRTWVGLTDEEIEASKPPLSNDAVVWELAVEWAQIQLKEKNA